MRKGIVMLVAFFAIGISAVTAQVQQVNLAQEPGVITTESLTLAAGDYQFNIANTNVETEVGFVIVPKGKYEMTDHIKEGYVKAPVKTGSSSMTSVVSLPAGEYEYFCPLNNTPKYSLTVVDDVEKITLGQVEGKFMVKSMELSKGSYQFEIMNNGVDHEVGFVLVKKGQYEMTDHIKEAYVKAPVANGSSSMTGIVDLEPGMYEYFCPLNPTPKYTIKVSE